MKILRGASLGSNFTGSYKKRVYYQSKNFSRTSDTRKHLKVTSTTKLVFAIK